MASRIITKKGSGAPLASDLVHGELAVDTVNKRLYTENAGGTVIEVGTSPSTIDINAGTIDGTVIGGSTPAAGSFTTISASGEIAANGGVAFGDNDKATFGASDDLQIYHDGSNSYIADAGTGALVLNSNQVLIKNADSTETLATFNQNSDVVLRYDNAQKLATTATGIDVTGTVTADGLAVDGTFAFTSAVNGIINNPASCFINIDSDNNNAGEAFYISRDADNTAGARVAKFDATGDISFYEDTGTTAKFFWDASAESLGIGTTSPDANLHISGTGNDAKIILEGVANPRGNFIACEGADDLVFAADEDNLGADSAMKFRIDATERMRIDSSGNVGIGTSSPAAKLEIGGAGEGIILASPDGTRYEITVANGGTLTVTAV